MPANVSVAKNFLLTTDFPLDKVVFLSSGTATVPFPTAGFKVTIPHGLSFTPLTSGNWAFTSSFSTSYEYGSGTFPSSNVGASNFDFVLNVSSDATNIYITPVNVSGSAVDIYYRVFGLEPSDSNADVPFTASSADDFVLSTDYNYTKLYIEGSSTGAAPFSSTATTSLGYRPQVSYWYTDVTATTYPLDVTQLSGTTNIGQSVIVDVNDVTFSASAFSSAVREDHRIYLDDNA